MNETADMNVEFYVNAIFINTSQESSTGCMTTGNSKNIRAKRDFRAESHDIILFTCLLRK